MGLVLVQYTILSVIRWKIGKKYNIDIQWRIFLQKCSYYAGLAFLINYI